MSDRKKYLKFEEREPPSTKTRLVAVVSRSSGIELGTISWYSSWRQYAFHPAAGTIFNPDCMDEISERVRAMTAEHRRHLQEKKRRG